MNTAEPRRCFSSERCGFGDMRAQPTSKHLLNHFLRLKPGWEVEVCHRRQQVKFCLFEYVQQLKSQEKVLQRLSLAEQKPAVECQRVQSKVKRGPVREHFYVIFIWICVLVRHVCDTSTSRLNMAKLTSRCQKCKSVKRIIKNYFNTFKWLTGLRGAASLWPASSLLTYSF